MERKIEQIVAPLFEASQGRQNSLKTVSYLLLLCFPWLSTCAPRSGREPGIAVPTVGAILCHGRPSLTKPWSCLCCEDSHGQRRCCAGTGLSPPPAHPQHGHTCIFTSAHLQVLILASFCPGFDLPDCSVQSSLLTVTMHGASCPQYILTNQEEDVKCKWDKPLDPT